MRADLLIVSLGCQDEAGFGIKREEWISSDDVRPPTKAVAAW